MEETVEQVQAKPEPVKISALELENVKRIRPWRSVRPRTD